MLVAAGLSALIIVFVAVRPSAGFGWAREPFVWAYIGALWIGGLRVFAGTFRPVAEVDGEGMVLRPLHQLRRTVIRWDDVRGSEQMIGGDRMIVYYDTGRGVRFVAFNLNLVKGRRDFVQLIDERLRALNFGERVVERSRYLSRQ